MENSFFHTEALPVPSCDNFVYNIVKKQRTDRFRPIRAFSPYTPAQLIRSVALGAKSHLCTLCLPKPQ